MQADPLLARAGAAGSPTGTPPDDPALRRAAQEFERMVLAQLLRQFTAGALRADEAQSPFATMLQDAYAGAMASSATLGIASGLLRALGAAGGRP